MTQGAELLESGARMDPRLPRRVPRPLAVTVSALMVAALVGALVAELRPWGGQPATERRVLVAGSDELTWVDVDTGGEREVAVADTPASDAVSVVGSGIVVRQPRPGPFADSVVGLAETGSVHQVGEADRVFVASSGSVWLVVDGGRGVEGGVVLASAFGTWRSRVLPTPPRLQVVGVDGDMLVALRGKYRGRELLLWDPQRSAPLGVLGRALAVHQVSAGHALVTTGCLSSGCSTAVVSLVDGSTTEVVAPPGWSEAGQATLVGPDGDVALVVADAQGETALALGEPDDLRVTEALSPASTQPLLDAGDGWLVVPLSGGDAVLWRPGLPADDQPRVLLAEGEQVLGVVPA